MNTTPQSQTEASWHRNVWSEVRSQLGFTWPVSLTTVCRFLVFTTSAVFVGNLGTPQLAAAIMCGSIFDSVACFGLGASLSLVTLCSQAVGAQNYRLAAIWYHIALVINALLSVVLIPLMAFTTGPVLRLMGLADDVVEYGRQFNYIYAARFLPVVVFQATRSFLNAQKIVRPALYVSVTATAANVGFNYVLIYGCAGVPALGFLGSPLASVLTSTAQMTLLLVYERWTRHERQATAPFALSNLTRRRFRQFAKMYVGTFASNASYAWVVAALAFLAGQLGTVSVAAQGVMYNVWAVMRALFQGICVATQTRVSYHLGGQRPRHAMLACLVGLGLSGSFCLLASAVVYPLSSLIARAYTPDENVIALVSDLRIYLIVTFTFASLGEITLFVLNACGRPKLSGAIALLTAVGIQLPLSYVLGLHYGYRLKGFWWANLLYQVVRFSVGELFVLRVDWAFQAGRAKLRCERTNSHLQSTPAAVSPAEQECEPPGLDDADPTLPDSYSHNKTNLLSRRHSSDEYEDDDGPPDDTSIPCVAESIQRSWVLP